MPTLLAEDISAEDKAEFVRLIYDGLKPDVAAKQLGSTGTQFRMHRSRNSIYYDEEFSTAYADAISSDEHATAFLERLRGIQQKLAFEDENIRMVEKLSYIYDPAWEVLRNPNLNVNVAVQLAQVVPGLTREQLEQARELLIEQKKRDELESGEVIEMPPAA